MIRRSDRPRQRALATLTLIAGIIGVPVSVFGEDIARSIADLNLRSAEYYLSQQQFLSGINQMVAAQDAKIMDHRGDEANLMLAELYLSYGMPKEADQILQHLASRAPTVESPSQTWLDLAYVYFKRGYHLEAERALSHLDKQSSDTLRGERSVLLAQIYIARNDLNSAITVLKGVEDNTVWGGYARYNMGVVLIKAGRAEEGLATLEQVGNLDTTHPELLALRDMANLQLGYMQLRVHKPDRAQDYFAKVRGKGPYATEQTLASGYAAWSAGQPRGALNAWGPLAQGAASGPAAQQAWLALPYAYTLLDDHTEALRRLGEAQRRYAAALEQVRAAMGEVENGEALDAALQAGSAEPELGYYWHMEHVPAGPAGPYLLNLATGHGFEEELKSYRDLRVLVQQLEHQDQDLMAFRNMISARKYFYEVQVPKALAQLRGSNINDLRARVAALKDELARIEREQDVVAVVPANEQTLWNLTQHIQTRLSRLRDVIVEIDDLERRYNLLRGLLIWRATDNFKENLWQAKKAVRELDHAVDDAARMQEDLLLRLQALGPDKGDVGLRIERLDQRRLDLLDRVQSLAERHRIHLQTLALAALRAEEGRLNTLIQQSRLAVAQVYERQARAARSKEGYDPAQLTRAIDAYLAVIDGQADTGLRRKVLPHLADLEILRADQGAQQATSDYRAAIAHYEQFLQLAPDAPDNDRALYRLAQAYERNADLEGMLRALDQIATQYRSSPLLDEVNFRRGELLFTLGRYAEATQAYGTIMLQGNASPYYERALYKHGWSAYKQGQYALGLDSFYTLLDRNLTPAAGGGEPKLARGEEELVSDAFRVVSLSHAQLGGSVSLTTYNVSRKQLPSYETRLYQELAGLYLGEGRVQDATDTYRAFIQHHPGDSKAPMFQAEIIKAYAQAGYTGLQLEAKAQFVEQYNPRSPYWGQAGEQGRAETLALVQDHITELARHYHARAQKTHTHDDVEQAERWYRRYLEYYPSGQATPEMNFLYAELLYDAGRYQDAAAQYEHAAYDYPAYARSAEAGYAALLAYNAQLETLKGDERAAWQRRGTTSSQRFADQFPQDTHTPAVLTRAAEDLYAMHDLGAAAVLAHRVIERVPAAEPGLTRSAWTVIAQSAFDNGDYAAAEQAYSQALDTHAGTDKEREDRLRLASAIYKQGEQAQRAGNLKTAIAHYLRVPKAAPGTAVAATGSYDAAANLIVLKDWRAAIDVLQAFRRDFPGHSLQPEVDAKLAVAYREAGDYGLAAHELEGIARSGASTELRQDAAWQAAELYAKAGRKADAAKAYSEYVAQYPAPLEPAVEARAHIADYYHEQNDATRYHTSLQQIIDADAQGGSARTDRTRYLAAQATLTLADESYSTFRNIKLTEPLKQTLQAKKQSMQRALDAYGRAAGYGMAEVTTAATYRIAELYHDLATALLKSERPKDLGAEELEQYNILLEEQAFPFEEKAIGIHESNAARVSAGIYDSWVQQSFEALRTLLPTRYAKLEKGDPYVDGAQ